MKKELLLGFVCGIAVPLGLLALAGRMQEGQPVPVQTDPASETRARVLLDRETTVRVLDTEPVEMSLDRYLAGVLAAEMPAGFHPEALKAQAVVARTYVCRRLAGGKHGACAVCTDPACCQGWRDPDEDPEAGKKFRRAVEDTDGTVLTYEGDLIDATYFSCSGGMTEDAMAVWGQDFPYLQAVESPGEEEAPRFQEETVFSPEEFLGRLELSSDQPPERWITGLARTEGNGIAWMEICGTVFPGTELRRLLDLRSTNFTVEPGEDHIVILTRGFGHRVGMSQYGAEAMAKDGCTWQEILSHYYRGAVWESMNQESKENEKRG